MEERRANDTKIEVLTARVEEWMEQTTDYRKSLCSKMDIVLTKLSSLPCKQAEEVTKSMRIEIGWLQKIIYTFLCFCIPSLLGLAMAWGALNNTVSRNTTKWNVMDSEHAQVVKDIAILKNEVESGKSS